MGHLHDQIKLSLTNHTPTPEQVEQIEALRVIGKALGFKIEECCPNTRERSLAVTKLEECIMWAVKSIVMPQPQIIFGSGGLMTVTTDTGSAQVEVHDEDEDDSEDDPW